MEERIKRKTFVTTQQKWIKKKATEGTQKEYGSKTERRKTIEGRKRKEKLVRTDKHRDICKRDQEIFKKGKI